MKFIRRILGQVALCTWLVIQSAGCYGAEAPVDEWTWLYTKKFTADEIQKHHAREEVVVQKNGVPEFSQLIFSWNALRPTEGYFTFFVSVRDARTHKWGAWHKMVSWGAQMQRSYASKPDGASRYLHVRLETGSKLANAFKIKMVASDGADLALVKGFSVNVSNAQNFKAEDAHKLALSSAMVKNVPNKSQMVLDHPRSHELCSPTSSSMFASYVAGCYSDPVEFARNVFDSGLNTYGSWPFNTAHAFELCNGAVPFAITRCNSFAQIHHYLKHGVPVVVSVRGYLEGAAKVYPHGHLLVVVGWDARTKEVICHDPAFHGDENTIVRYPCASFLIAWERSRRLAYIAHPQAISYSLA